jgi:hypothetical protein
MRGDDMKVSPAFTRDLTTATISGLMQYYETIEDQLKGIKQHEKQKIHEYLQELDVDFEEYLAEREIANQEYAATFEMLFTNFFRFSCVILLYLVIEDKLQELCRAAKIVRKASAPVPDHPRSPIKEYKDYLKKEISLINIDWSKVDELNKVRNCIVHHSGRADNRKDPFLYSMAGKVPGFHINSREYQSIEGIEPLYLEEEMIVLDKIYCQQAIQEIGALFEQICDAIPLRSFVFHIKKQ